MEKVQKKEITKNLTQLRKQYDKIQEKISQLQKSIIQKRTNIEKVKEIETELLSDKQNILDELAECDEKKCITQQKQKKAMLDRATYKYMIKRMKHDKISYQLQVQKLDRTLKKIIQQSKRGKKEFFEKNQLKKIQYGY